MKNVKNLVPIICVLVGLGIGFLGGFEFKNYQLKKNFGNSFGANGSQRSNGANQQGAGRAGAVMGNILSVSGNSVTVKLTDGSSKIVLLGGSTTYSNTVDATISDLKVGENVVVFGSSNTDGSVTATSVQINPKFQMNFGQMGGKLNSATKTTTKTTTTSSGQPDFGGPPFGM